jgi:hypothetical protein
MLATTAEKMGDITCQEPGMPTGGTPWYHTQQAAKTKKTRMGGLCRYLPKVRTGTSLLE